MEIYSFKGTEEFTWGEMYGLNGRRGLLCYMQRGKGEIYGFKGTEGFTWGEMYGIEGLLCNMQGSHC